MANQLTLVGNVGKDPEIKKADKAPKAEFANFVICVNHMESGKKHADWFNVSVTNQHIVAFVKEHVKKGDMVFVSGQLKLEEYTTATGAVKSSVKCVVSFDGQIRKLSSAVAGAVEEDAQADKRVRGGE
jgi:single stranded DNA-binding protein